MWGKAIYSNDERCRGSLRLPDASRDHKHIRDVFYRMGFNDQEIVALSGLFLQYLSCDTLS